MIRIETDPEFPLEKAADRAAAIIRALDVECVLAHEGHEIIVTTRHATQLVAQMKAVMRNAEFDLQMAEQERRRARIEGLQMAIDSIRRQPVVWHQAAQTIQDIIDLQYIQTGGTTP